LNVDLLVIKSDLSYDGISICFICEFYILHFNADEFETLNVKTWLLKS